MRDVAIIGVGGTEFGELWNDSLRDLGIRAGLAAMLDAGISSEDIDALYIGNMAAGRFVDQEHIAPLIVDYAGLAGRHIPAIRVEAACASGGVALHEGFLAVASGMYDTVIVGGAEKMTDVSDEEATEVLAMSADQEWEAFFGATFPSLFALMARRHMHEFGTTREQMAAVAVKNHNHGALNPLAQFRSRITLDTVLKATMVADPLGTFDCSPISDGASAVVLMALDTARKVAKQPLVRIAGSAVATDSLGITSREDLVSLPATRVAAREAFKQAGRAVKDIQIAEVHDCFTIAELMALEDIGFAERGKAGKAVQEGQFDLIGGRVPVNTSGGLKARGHPCGATGVAQAVEIVTQLRGKAEQRQVKGDPRIGLTHNVGGSGASVAVHVLEAV